MKAFMKKMFICISSFLLGIGILSVPVNAKEIETKKAVSEDLQITPRTAYTVSKSANCGGVAVTAHIDINAETGIIIRSYITHQGNGFTASFSVKYNSNKTIAYFTLVGMTGAGAILGTNKVTLYSSGPI